MLLDIPPPERDLRARSEAKQPAADDRKPDLSGKPPRSETPAPVTEAATTVPTQPERAETAEDKIEGEFIATLTQPAETDAESETKTGSAPEFTVDAAVADAPPPQQNSAPAPQAAAPIITALVSLAAEPAGTAEQPVEAAPVSDAVVSSETPSAALASTSRPAKPPADLPNSGEARVMQAPPDDVPVQTSTAESAEAPIAAEPPKSHADRQLHTRPATAAPSHPSAPEAHTVDETPRIETARANDGPANPRPAADQPQPFVVSAASANATAATLSSHAPLPTPAGQPIPVAGLAVEIAAHAQAGRNRFTIRLDPPELGRIDVRLDVDQKGHVTSRLMIERVETFDLLRRDASSLERALNDAGFKTGDQTLQFSLRDQAFARREGPQAAPNSAWLVVPDDEAATDDLPRSYAGLGLGTGLDIRV
jgi:flagellar hook-length control protein FliK